eukprot:UN04291
MGMFIWWYKQNGLPSQQHLEPHKHWFTELNWYPQWKVKDYIDVCFVMSVGWLNSS